MGKYLRMVKISKYWPVTIQAGTAAFNRMKGAKLPALLNYCIFGLEKAPTTGREHIQGFLLFKKRQRISGVHGALAQIYMEAGELDAEEQEVLDKKIKKAHLEKMYSTVAANVTYCKKEEMYFELGEYIEPEENPEKLSRRVRIEMMYNDMTSGKKSKFEAIRNDPDLINYAHMFANQCDAPSRKAPKVLYLSSMTGKGKTTNTARAIERSKMTYYTKPSMTKWWPRYHGQRVVVLEEFTSCFNVTTFLQLCDATPFSVEQKGGWTDFNSEFIIMLSNTKPEDQYQKVFDDNKARWDAYYRRVQNHHNCDDMTFDQIENLVYEVTGWFNRAVNLANQAVRFVALLHCTC